MSSITSRSNKEISDVANIVHHRKDRRSHGLFVAEGIRTVGKLIEAGIVLKRLYVLESLPAKDFDELLALCGKQGLNPQTLITTISKPVLEKISDTQTPSGIVGLFVIPQPQVKSLAGALVLANITVPGNMGTIIRTAAALGKKTVVIIDGTDVYGPKVVQASAGAVGLVNILECSWDELLQRKNHIPLHALVVKDGHNPATMNEPDAILVVGNEAHGLPQAWVNDCEQKITLPMPGDVESLNAALAVSIVMYVNYLRTLPI